MRFEKAAKEAALTDFVWRTNKTSCETWWRKWRKAFASSRQNKPPPTWGVDDSIKFRQLGGPFRGSKPQGQQPITENHDKTRLLKTPPTARRLGLSKHIDVSAKVQQADSVKVRSHNLLTSSTRSEHRVEDDSYKCMQLGARLAGKKQGQRPMTMTNVQRTNKPVHFTPVVERVQATDQESSTLTASQTEPNRDLDIASAAEKPCQPSSPRQPQKKTPSTVSPPSIPAGPAAGRLNLEEERVEGLRRAQQLRAKNEKLKAAINERSERDLSFEELQQKVMNDMQLQVESSDTKRGVSSSTTHGPDSEGEQGACERQQGACEEEQPRSITDESNSVHNQGETLIPAQSRIYMWPDTAATSQAGDQVVTPTCKPDSLALNSPMDNLCSVFHVQDFTAGSSNGQEPAPTFAWQKARPALGLYPALLEYEEEPRVEDPNAELMTEPGQLAEDVACRCIEEELLEQVCPMSPTLLRSGELRAPQQTDMPRPCTAACDGMLKHAMGSRCLNTAFL